MLKEETRVLNIDINSWARPCDTCLTAACTVYCRADSAYLCATCDSDIHSANPLARRHLRVPILPIHSDQTNVFEDVDEYLDLVDYKNDSSTSDNQYMDQYNNNYCYADQKGYFGEDSVVPVEDNQFNFQFEMEFDTKKVGYGFPASISHSVSVSSMDVSLVPESTTSEVSISHHPRPPKGTIDLFSSPPVQMMPTQLTPMDREARVLRYREKKKTRKFEKTIRYASRKAYAETRPRIKGRFAKRTDVDVEVDQMFVSSVFADGGYGIVPLY